MRFADPLTLKARAAKISIIFAASQRTGEPPTQEDYFSNYNDECFAVADGVGGMAHGEVAAKLACETAVWAYKHVRLRPFYWDDKKLFLKRIFRTTNITVWQKQREKGFDQGMATTLATCILGEKSFWVGSVGDSQVYHLEESGTFSSLLPIDADPAGKLTNALGKNRYGLVPHVKAVQFGRHDTILLATDGVCRYIEETMLGKLLSMCGNSSASLSATVEEILRAAAEGGSTDNMTAVLIKRIVR